MMKNLRVRNTLAVLYLSLFLSQLFPVVVDCFQFRRILAFQIPLTLHSPHGLRYANEGSESLNTAIHTSAHKRHSGKHLFRPLRKATFHLGVFLQHQLCRILGKERWNTIQSKIRSITEKYTIYVLECENGKYYVGSTQNKKKRFHQHLVSGRGSVWTREYKPIRVLKQYKRIPKDYALGLESKVTAETMLKYGINNVRGSMFCNVQNYTLRELDPLTRFLGHYNDLNYGHVRETLKQQLPSTSTRRKSRSSRTRASVSSLLGQNSTDSSSAEVVELENLDQEIEWTTEEFEFIRRRDGYQRRIDPNDRCYRCGQVGHWAVNCPN